MGGFVRPVDPVFTALLLRRALAVQSVHHGNDLG